MNIVGIDLSVRATGLAMLSDNWDIAGQEPVSRLPGEQKIICGYGPGAYIGALAIRRSTDHVAMIEDILLPVLEWARHAHQVLIEGYSYGSHNMHAVAELGGIVRYHLRKIGHNPVEVSPKTLKKFIAGNGNADKDKMLAAVQAMGIPVLDHNMADAFGLAKFGYSLQQPDSVNLELHHTEREALHAVKYPVIKSRPKRAPKLNLGGDPCF